MTDRWRGRATGLAIVGLLAIGVAVSVVGSALGRPTSAAGEPPTWALAVRAADDAVLLRVPLAGDRFTLRYRNSVYASTAEERFEVRTDGRLALVQLAADEAAVLDEYYASDRVRPADPGDARRFQAEPADVLELTELEVAATELGRRTLVVAGHEPVELWRLVADGDPGVSLSAEPAP